jgi:hypothetical protein
MRRSRNDDEEDETMSDMTDDHPLDEKASQILSVVRECWLLLAGLDPIQKTLAIDRLRVWLAQEEANTDPAHDVERRH